MAHGYRRRAIPVAALCIFLSLAGSSLAQGPLGPSVTASADRTTFEALEPGASATATLTVRNGGSLDGTVTLGASPGSGGWTVAVEPASLQVGAGQTGTATVTVTAPPSRDGAGQAFAAEVTTTIQDALGNTAAAAPVALQATLAAAPPPPPPPPEFPWIPILAILAVVAAVAGYALAGWRRENGILVVAEPAAKEARPGYDAYVPVTVRNVSGRPRVAEVALEGVPRGWAAGINLTKMALEPGQSESLWLAIRPPLTAERGDVVVRVLAKPVEARAAKNPAAVTIKVMPDGVVPHIPGRDLIQPLHQRSDLGNRF